MSYHPHSDPDALTPADVLTPHGEPEQERIEEPEEEVVQGLLDPRALPGPEILDPPPLSLPEPDFRSNADNDC